jgi:hypothetical protein
MRTFTCRSTFLYDHNFMLDGRCCIVSVEGGGRGFHSLNWRSPLSENGDEVNKEGCIFLWYCDAGTLLSLRGGTPVRRREQVHQPAVREKQLFNSPPRSVSSSKISFHFSIADAAVCDYIQ